MSHIDLEQGRIGDRQLSFRDSEDVVSCFHSNTYGYYDDDTDEYSSSVSSVSDESEKSVCRICKSEVGYGQGLIELGCSCKGDLAFSHRQCAETWFKLKGNQVCEICHSDARNVIGANEMVEEEEEEEEEEVMVVVEVEEEGAAAVGEDGESWWKRRMVLIFVITCWVSPFSIYFLVIQN
ncbi:unnamed protein product [Brassica rapa]|uniref:RING-CH-type domain-containing protein n=1 Tax=Brassica campestris TaxID=3711 RepID=A0A3P6BYL4_BRACM|nr:unnamed protein product [Brassica rapa]VDD11053.1 unnamed protein product [Brassica rapa]